MNINASGQDSNIKSATSETPIKYVITAVYVLLTDYYAE